MWQSCNCIHSYTLHTHMQPHICIATTPERACLQIPKCSEDSYEPSRSFVILKCRTAQEEKEITGALKKNGYPSSSVYKHSCPGRPRPDREEQRPKATLTLPYISNPLEAIRRVLAPVDIQVVFHPLMTLHQLLVHPKDRAL